MIQQNLLQVIQAEKVEWKTLGEVAEIRAGQAISKQLISQNEGIYPVINSGKEPLGFIDKWNTDNDPIGVTTRGAGVGSITWQEGKYFRGNLNYSVTIKKNIKLEVRFLYHILLELENEIHELCTFTGIPALNASSLKTLKIPVPNLPIQQKIVKILDKMTELEATLEAELSQRRRQYEYYRNALLDFDNRSGGVIAKLYPNCLKDVAWKTLGEICSVGIGKAPETTESGQYFFINAGTIPSGNLSSYNTEPDTITTPSRGQGGIGYVGYQSDYFWCGPLSYRIRSTDSKVLTRYVYYVMANKPEKIIGLANMTGVPALNRKDLINLLLPIPPLEIQAKIVAILDQFDTFTQSISQGLPCEIALRRRQYEYYREQLLNFAPAA